MLTVCPHCYRHLDVRESSCPFCRTRSSRNLQMLAAVAIGFATASCSSNTTAAYAPAPPTTSDAADANADASDSATTDTTPYPNIDAAYAAVPDPDR
jgi:hypothetical protein